MVPHIANLYPQLASRTTTTTMSVCRSGLISRTNRGLANLPGRGVLVVDTDGVARPWPELPPQMERFLGVTFLVERLDGVQVSECWCPDVAVKKGLMALGWSLESIWTRDGS